MGQYRPNMGYFQTVSEQMKGRFSGYSGHHCTYEIDGEVCNRELTNAEYKYSVGKYSRPLCRRVHQVIADYEILQKRGVK